MMTSSVTRLSASEAARQLGVSIKALRLYEQQGLLTPDRSPAGYRVYAPDDMVRGAKVVMLRSLGLSLAEVARVLNGDPQGLRAALASHETSLDVQIHALLGKLDKVRALRADLAHGQMPHDGELTRLLDRKEITVAFELPWPWAGEWFELRDIRPLNYIIGSLGSGKTRLALRVAEALSEPAG
jgi:DNA-binding transcriptional MerR regulator